MMTGVRLFLLFYVLHSAAALYSLEELKRRVYHGAEQLTQFINTYGSKIGLEHFCDKYRCPQGQTLVNNRSAPLPSSNGCGTYGITIPRALLPMMTACCDVHDICYGTCGMQRKVCDRRLNFCLDRICANLTEQPERLRKADPEGCWQLVRLFDALVRNLGCRAFLTAQAMYCHCR